MSEHNELGRIGEQEACFFLIEKGYSLLERNWTTGRLEIDIIADYYGEVVFVEVKTRTEEIISTALEAVDRDKREHLRKAARAYLALHDLDVPFRFDIITVVGHCPPFTIRHYRGAF